MKRGAVISPCGRYRYLLTREWGNGLHEGPGPTMFLLFVMLNPSTADADTDDPTIRKCIGFAQRLGYGGLQVVNLFPFRATDPGELHDYRSVEEVEAENDRVVLAAMEDCGTRVAAWGAYVEELGERACRRAERMRQMLSNASPRWRAPQVVCLGTTKTGQPRHPLYVGYSKLIEPYADSPVPASSVSGSEE
jgi:hypothetical protein